MLVRICNRHDITIGKLAQLTGLDHSYCSRIVSGQFGVPAEVMRTLYRHTGDGEIAEWLLGRRPHEHSREHERRQALALYHRANHRLLSVTPGDDRHAITDAMNDMQRALQSIADAYDIQTVTRSTRIPVIDKVA